MEVKQLVNGGIDSRIQRFKDSRIQRFKDLRIQGFEDLKIQGFRNLDSVLCDKT